jgi:hypothetical protein
MAQSQTALEPLISTSSPKEIAPVALLFYGPRRYPRSHLKNKPMARVMFSIDSGFAIHTIHRIGFGSGGRLSPGRWRFAQECVYSLRRFYAFPNIRQRRDRIFNNRIIDCWAQFPRQTFGCSHRAGRHL